MQTKPTLLVTASTFPRWESDSEPRFVYDLSKRLSSDFNIIVLAPHAAGTAKEEYWDGLQVYRYRYAPERLETLAYEGGLTANLKRHPWKYLLLPSFFIGQWLALRKLLKSHQVQVIHAHWLIPQGLVAVFAIRWAKQSPSLVCTSHGGDLFGLQDKLSLALKRWVISRCQAMTVVSHAMVDKVRNLSINHDMPIHVIPMGTNLDSLFTPAPHIQRLPNQLLFVGRLVEKKGLKYLLQALKKVRKTLPDVNLVIAGSGPLQTQLEDLARELKLTNHVIFKGRLGHLELVHLYRESTIAIFPFIQAADGDMEGLGLVMVEAIGCECPIIVSNLPAINDVIKNNQLIVPPYDPDALSEKIIITLNNPILRKNIAVTTREQVKDKFDWQQITKSYKELLLIN